MGYQAWLDRARGAEAAEGVVLSDWLLQPRRRAEQAFVSVIVDTYLAGRSTRRVKKLVQQLGFQRMSKSQFSLLAKSLDQIVEDFRSTLVRTCT